MPTEPMTEELAASLHRRALVAARKYGFAEHAEDIAQNVMLQYLEGMGQHQLLDNAVIDAIRKMFGRPRSPSHRQRQNLETYYQRLETREVTKLGVYDLFKEAGFEEMISQLKGIDRAIIVLKYKWGFLDKEIGHAFHRTECWTSLKITEITQRLHKTLSKELFNGDVE